MPSSESGSDQCPGPGRPPHSSQEGSTVSLPVIPLPDGVVLPEMVITLSSGGDGEDAAAINEVLTDTSTTEVLLVPRIDNQFARIGVIATIEDRGQTPEDLVLTTLRATARAKVGTGIIGPSGALHVEATIIVEPDPTPEVVAAATNYRTKAANLLQRMGAGRAIGILPDVDRPGPLADSIAYRPELSLEQRLDLLETVDVLNRLELATTWLSEAASEFEVRNKIQQDVVEELETSQREAILRRQLAAIQSELGEADGDAIATYRASLAELVEAGVLSTATVEAIGREIDRLERAGNESTESNWIRTWLDTVFELPWLERDTEQLDLPEARAILDRDHTGLEDVKDRLVEYLAVRKLRTIRPDPTDEVADATDPETKRSRIRGGNGAILALVGPPGVGKTSLGQSIADALGRSFVRLSLGGIRDEAEIRGHRRTYVGSRPGRLVAALKEAGTMNPVVLLDEIDKVSGGINGDPSAALLEVLDPAQNHSFRDHYLEFELDLSDIVFVATANVMDTIPGPLLDRLEIISLDGYTEPEKVTIARDHLLPRLIKSNGLRPDEVQVGDETLERLVGDYTHEAGVRNLERKLDRVLRKTASSIAQGIDATNLGIDAPDTDATDSDTADTDVASQSLTATEPTVIDPEDLQELLGKPRPQEEVAGRIDRAGIATGLAVTGAGGDVLFVESALVRTGDAKTDALTSDPIVTGQLGDVMKESATIVRSIVANYLHDDKTTDEQALPQSKGKRLHIHFPAGAVPKDGPSAGVTMTTALISLFTDTPVRADVAMTGEITLQGRVLPIGGVKQKVMAAHRAGITDVILPVGNEPDIDEIPDSVLEEMTIHLATTIGDVLNVALPAAA